MKRIIVKHIAHKKQRYDTVGDYWMDKTTMQVRISTPKSKQRNIDFYCFLIHELVEAFLAKHRGIKWSDIDKFDIESGLLDPGASKKAPYNKEHEFANRIEKMFLKELKK